MKYEFEPFGKVPRLHRDVILTEKIDGTNGLIQIQAVDEPLSSFHVMNGVLLPGPEPVWLRVGSRKRWITPTEDNHGFARWVWDNAVQIAQTLGVGSHYGEWWGSGIQRGYGQTEKHFSLFNVHRWGGEIGVFGTTEMPDLRVVPTLSEFNAIDLNAGVQHALDDLREMGSTAAPDFMNPEGVMAFHVAAGKLFKVTIVDDFSHKELGLHNPSQNRTSEPIQGQW